MDEATLNVEMIRIELINIVNPRARNRKGFQEIVDNVAEVGLKRPITVSRRDQPDGLHYDLVCGQGRLEAFVALGEHQIPAIVIDTSSEDCMVMSLVENLARRQHRAIDLLRDIEGMKRRGYDEDEIAAKAGLSVEYTKGVIRLLETGEHRLLRAVEAGQIPVSIAVQIAGTDDAGTQRVLQQAYEDKLLRGRKLMAGKRLIEQRRRRGRGLRTRDPGAERAISVDGLLRTYQEDTAKKRLMVRKAELTRERLVFVVEALRSLFSDDHFIDLLRAEGLDTVPRKLGDRLHSALTV
jgi:ParB family transcriptional regulator, chromosome partitioning protein